MPEVVGDWDLTFNPVQIPYEMFLNIENLPRLHERAKWLFSWEKAAKETIEVYKKVIE